MGEKGNLLDMGEEIFANLAEQGPQFWLNYEQYKLSRAQSARAGVVVEQQAAAVAEPDAARPRHRWSAHRPPLRRRPHVLRMGTEPARLHGRDRSVRGRRGRELAGAARDVGDQPASVTHTSGSLPARHTPRGIASVE